MGHGGGIGPQVPDRPAVSQTGRGLGGPAERRDLECPTGRQNAGDPQMIGRHAGRPGPCRDQQCSVGPPHAQPNALKPWQQQQWVIPPPAKAEFVWAMADGREVYTRPDNPRRPQGCVDEPSQPRVAETRVPIPAAPGRPARVEYEYARQGTANLLMVCAPLASQRLKVTERRTAVDVAHLIRAVVEEPYPQAKKIVLVMDSLNTPKPASLYEAFVPTEARRWLERLEIPDTPQHGSGLKMAETDRSVVATPCVDHRLPDQPTFGQEVTV
jgi:hypothetical protein